MSKKRKNNKVSGENVLTEKIRKLLIDGINLMRIYQDRSEFC